MTWSQVYDPTGSLLLSTILAALPVIVLLGAIGIFEMKAHLAALLGLVSALLIAILVFGMPTGMAVMSAVYGAGFGLWPIGWIILNIIFLYQLTHEKGEFDILQRSIRNISDDRRLQLLFIAFCFGAFFEGAAGFGTPVAVSAAMLIGLGFSPLAASGLSLIANTAPVAFGALGSPVIALAAVTELDLLEISGMIGRQLPFFSVIVPIWLIWAFVGFRRMLEVLPALLVAGISFAIPQYLVSNFHGPWLVDIVAAIVSMICLALFLRVWHPKNPMTEAPRDWSSKDLVDEPHEHPADVSSRGAVMKAWLPWLILSVFVFLWGTPQVKTFLDGIWVAKLPVAGLHNLVMKVPPVVAAPHAEAAVFNLNLLSATGTGILVAAIISGFILGYRPAALVRMYGRTIYMIRYSLLTIACMLALGYVTRYSGTDATMGLAFAQAGWLYPLFGGDGLGHGLQRAVRRPAEGHRPADRCQPGADGGGQQLGRGHGQDDRRAEHRRRLDRDQVVRARGKHPALRLLPFDRPGGPGRPPGDGAGLRAAVHRHGARHAARHGARAAVSVAAAAQEPSCAALSSMPKEGRIDG
jgi:lactate permease